MVTDTPYPDAPGQAGNIKNMSALLGIGAYQIDDASSGSGTNFGQDITGEDFVKSFVYSTAMNMGPGDGTIASALTNLGTFLNTMSLDALKLLQPFIPGSTNADFVDTETAVETVLGQFNIQLMMSLEAFQQWLDDIFNPNSFLWADAKAWWDTLFAQLSSYPTAGSSAATVATWWSTLFVDLGLDPTLSATVANIISGNYDWAKTAAANWTAFMASWGVGTPADVAAATLASQAKWNAFLASIGLGSATAAGAQLAGNNTSITTQQAWWSRMAEDLWIIYGDGLHLYYPLGTPSDTATTTSTAYGPARRTWYSAQADWKQLWNDTKGTTAPAAVSGDVGTFAIDTHTTVVTNQDTLATVQAAVDSLITANPSVAGQKFVSTAGTSGSTWGSQWTVAATNGNIATKSSLGIFDMTLVATSTIDLKLTGRFTAGVTLTDDQIVSAVFQDAAKSMAGGTGPKNTIKSRMDSAGNNYVYARVNYNSVQLGYAVSGVEQTAWATASSLTVPAGALVELVCGTAAGHRKYQVRVNGAVVIDYTESGTSSQMGASYRGGGQDMLATKGIANDTFPPARITQFKLQDSNATATTYGTSARFYRASTTAVALSKGAAVGLGSTIYDTTEYCSPDIVMGTSGLAIYTPGRYRVTHAIRISSLSGSWAALTGSTTGAVLQHVTPGPTISTYSQFGFTNNDIIHISGTYEFNAIGDGGVSETWAPGPSVSGSGTYYLLGEGTGIATYLTVSRIA
jgi:hypothetical protein